MTELEECLKELDRLDLPNDSYMIIGRAAVIANGVDIEFKKPLRVLAEPSVIDEMLTYNDFLYKVINFKGILLVIDYMDNRICFYQSLPFSPKISIYQWFRNSIIINGLSYLSGGYRNENLVDYYFDLYCYTNDNRYKEIADKIIESRLNI